jgi:hypothetical protein
VDFLPSLAVEILGGLATGVVLAAAAAGYAAWRSYHSHDAALRDLRDDTRRWLRDRDRDLQVQTNAAITTMAARGLLYAGAFLTALADLKRQALQEYRDEMSRKRTRYRGLLDGETWAHRRFRGRPLDRYELADDDRVILAAWRAPATYEGHPDDSAPVDDPTSEEREPDLRRFEREGDPPRG